MCIIVTYDGKEYRTVRELRPICPHIVPEVRPEYDDDCLCGIDAEATAEANGFRAEPDDFGYTFTEAT